MMALPNLAALLLLSPEALRMIFQWSLRQKKARKGQGGVSGR